MIEIEIHLTVNGTLRTVRTEPMRTLLKVLREDLGLTGTKEGCGVGDCGACVVIMDGHAVNACLVMAAQTDGSVITSVEGLARSGKLHILQREFAEKWAFQCGFCTPGMLMSCYGLLLHNPAPTEPEIRDAISGNLCRCTSYHNVVAAVIDAATELRGGPTQD